MSTSSDTLTEFSEEETLTESSEGKTLTESSEEETLEDNSCYDELKALAKKSGWHVKSKYRGCNSNDKVTLRCALKHEVETTPSKFLKRQKCKDCSNLKNNPKQQKVCELAKTLQWQVKSGYVDARTPIDFICKSNHKLSMPPSYFYTIHCCKECKKLEKYEELKVQLKEYEVKIISGSFVNAASVMKVKCVNGHRRTTTYTQLRKKPACPKCTCLRHKNKEDKYQDVVKRAEEYNWKVISKAYTLAADPMKFKCPGGHKLSIVTDIFMVKSRGPICEECRTNKLALDFKESIEKAGGKVVGEYVKGDIKVACICPEGHKCNIKPHSFNRFHNMCSKCTKRCRIQGMENFYSIVERLGGKVLGSYIKADTKVLCICVNGHECSPYPFNLKRGEGMCSRCAGHSKEESEENFRIAIDEFGGTIVGEYVNNTTPVECVCSAGHTCFTLPRTAMRGFSMCVECAGYSPEVAGRNFTELVEQSGYKLKEEYAGTSTKLKALCSKGHKITLLPSRVKEIGVSCKECNGGVSMPERVTKEAIEFLGYKDYDKEYSPSSLSRLRFDFRILHKNKIIFVESDGIQHQQCTSRFHETLEEFDAARQRDLVKNYYVRNTKNIRLIRIDHTLFKSKDGQTPLERVTEYLREGIKSKAKIYASDVYKDWIDDEPLLDSVEKYFLED